MRLVNRRGFTLAELMVTITIIALLAAILIPALSNAFDSVRRTLCLNNLDKIGQAYHTHNAAGRIHGDPNFTNVWGSMGWPGAILKNASESQELLICPESDSAAIGGALTLEELGMLYVVSYGPDRWTGQWEATEYTLGQGLTEGWPVGIANRSMYWEVQNRSNNSITVAMEDSWQDNPASNPYKDLVLRFDFQGDQTRVTYVSQGTGAFHYSLHYPSGEEILVGMGRGENHGQEGKLWATIRSLRETSYGMSSQAYRIEGPKRVVLALDYNKAIADCAGCDARDVDDWAKYIGLRHRGKANVLWEDGAVRNVYEGEIDPRTEEGRRNWGP